MRSSPTSSTWRAAARATGSRATRGPNVLTGRPGQRHPRRRGRTGLPRRRPGQRRSARRSGRTGDGDVQSGGDGIDMVNYAARKTGVRVTVGVGADDGSPGEGDDVRADIETVVGSQGDDVIIAAPTLQPRAVRAAGRTEGQAVPRPRSRRRGPDHRRSGQRRPRRRPRQRLHRGRRRQRRAGRRLRQRHPEGSRRERPHLRPPGQGQDGGR